MVYSTNRSEMYRDFLNAPLPLTKRANNTLDKPPPVGRVVGNWL